MKLGTVSFKSKLCNLDSMKKEEIDDIIQQNSIEINNEFTKAKNICDRENLEDKKENLQDISKSFKSFIDNASISVRLEAMLYRASVDKLTYETINQKVKNQRNSIYASIKKINSKFNNTNSKYSEVQSSITETMIKYEKILQELAQFYDNKIEQLILRKVELQAHLVGKIIRKEFLIEEEMKKKDAKENDKLLSSLSNSIKTAISKLTKKKSENQIDVTMITKLQDKEEVEEEQIQNLKNSLQKTINNQQDNIDSISKIEKEILSIEKEIKRLNENKKNILINAMESENKKLVIVKEKKSIITKIKLFIKGKFNTPKVIYDTIINPLNENINNFLETEFENIKEI